MVNVSPRPSAQLVDSCAHPTRAHAAAKLIQSRASPAPRPRRTVPHPRLARATLAPHPRLTRASPAPHCAAPAPRPRRTCMRTCALPAPPHPRRTRASPVPHPSLARAAHAARLRLLATIGYLQILVNVTGSQGLDARSAFRKF